MTEAKEGIISFAMLSKAVIHCANQMLKEVLISALLAVRLGYKNQGLGGELIGKAGKAACKLGYPTILLVGDPNYYNHYCYSKSLNEF